MIKYVDVTDNKLLQFTGRFLISLYYIVMI